MNFFFYYKYVWYFHFTSKTFSRTRRLIVPNSSAERHELSRARAQLKLRSLNLRDNTRSFSSGETRFATSVLPLTLSFTVAAVTTTTAPAGFPAGTRACIRKARSIYVPTLRASRSNCRRLSVRPPASLLSYDVLALALHAEESERERRRWRAGHNGIKSNKAEMSYSRYLSIWRVNGVFLLPFCFRFRYIKSYKCFNGSNWRFSLRIAPLDLSVFNVLSFSKPLKTPNREINLSKRTQTRKIKKTPTIKSTGMAKLMREWRMPQRKRRKEKPTREKYSSYEGKYASDASAD